MAKIKICDICGDECVSDDRYKLVRKCSLGGYKQDICSNCLQRIKDEIRKEKIQIIDSIAK